MSETHDNPAPPIQGVHDAYPGGYSAKKPWMTGDEYRCLLPHVVPVRLLIESEVFLRSSGAQGREGAILWVGEQDGGCYRVTHVIAPQQVASRWHFEVPLDERIRVATSLCENEIVILQIHSHPDEAFHSPTDDRKAMVDRQWALSVVVPDFCRGELRSLTQAAVYSLRGPLDWVQLTAAQIRNLFIIE
jgi:hypothetical protein